MTMESAIPPHLRLENSCPRRGYENFRPPFPAFVARYHERVDRIVMAYFGVQFKADQLERARAALDKMALLLERCAMAGHCDQAHYVDEAGYDTIIIIAYWRDAAQFHQLFAQMRSAWLGSGQTEMELGFFLEIVRPAADSFETLFTSPHHPAGAGMIADSFSHAVQEHAYWGGMRDRLPRSYAEPLAPSGTIRAERDGKRCRIIANENLCLIRSGQDWSETDKAERSLYLNEVEPVLRAGMDFLAKDGLAIGCFANRFMQVTDRYGNACDKAFGVSWWHSLGDLESWAESHATHLKIFGAAMKYLTQFGAEARLRLYHEVTVVRAADQHFEYFNCHADTGLLRSLTRQDDVILQS